MRPPFFFHPKLAAYFLLVVASFAMGAYSFFVAPALVLKRNDGVRTWEARMLPIKAKIPASVKIVGYISDQDIDKTWESKGNLTEVDEYPLTQYALAPLIVLRGVNFEWIIGNFTLPRFKMFLDTQINAPYSLDPIGFGIYLIHREVK
jgi:hypothetical protein